MQIVIDIPEETYEYWKEHSYEYVLSEAIKNGTQLPKGHGRLVDLDKMIAYFWDGCYMEIGEEELNKIKTIIPASSN